MKNDVSVIVPDRVILVDGLALQFDFAAGENVRAVQWHNQTGHIELLDGTNVAVASYDKDVRPYVALWEAEKARLDALAAAQLEEENQIEKVRARAMARIDAATSAAILAGFDHRIDPGTGTPETLHFSYDSFDQQNFADTANMALLSLSMPTGLSEGSGLDAGSLPDSVTWNAYRAYTPQTGGELVRLTLDAAGFLALYTGGALAHKARQMEAGGRRKAAVEAAATVADIEAVLTGLAAAEAAGAQA